MTLGRVRLVGAFVLLAMLTSVSAPLGAFAQDACAARPHACDEQPTIAECCCHLTPHQAPATVPPEQTAVLDSAPAPVAICAFGLRPPLVPPPASRVPLVRVLPRSGLIDFSTLFSILLI
jgi:hypothetical protein